MTVAGGGREGQPGDATAFDPAAGEAWDGDDGASEQLDLDEDEPLPWLESSDYEEEEGVDTGRIIGFVILALLALGLIIGLVWYLANRDNGTQAVPDGSTIAAPDAPAKTRPDDPGGKQFRGTGDVAPAVGEGQTREGRLADTKRVPIAPEPAGEAAEGGDAPAAAAPGGVAVQVGALNSRAVAEARWQQLNGMTDALSGVSYRIQQAQIDNGTVYRLQAMAGDRAAANRLCEALKADGIECIVK